jgi:fibronectin-binding autotransporter adhesin
MKKHNIDLSIFHMALCAGLMALATGCPETGDDPVDPNGVDRLLVTTLADEDNDDEVVSLREAVAYAQEQAGAQTVKFEAGLTGQIALGSPIAIAGDASNALVIELEAARELNVKAASGERVMTLEGPALTIKRLNIVGSAVSDSDGGGCILASAGTLTLEGLSMSACESSAEGGAVRALEDVSVFIDDVKFGDNKADRGGAVMARGALSVKNSAFTNNDGAGSGGAIHASGGLLSVEQSVFDANTSDSGAGIYADNGDAQVTVKMSEFTGNVASFRGGALYVKHSGDMVERVNVSISGTTFKKNSDASSGGGAVAVTGVSTVIVDACVFEENTSMGKGGGMDGEGKLVMTGTTFSKNTSANAGGGLSFVGSMRVEGGAFEDNSAEDGGAMNLSASGALLIKEVSVKGNTASRHGGGLVVGSTVDMAQGIVGGSFEGNAAAQQGGGIYASCSLNITGTAIKTNTAEFGGGVVTSAGTMLTLRGGAQVVANQATSASASATNKIGGGVSNDGDVVISGASVMNNMPDDFSAPDRVTEE